MRLLSSTLTLPLLALLNSCTAEPSSLTDRSPTQPGVSNTEALCAGGKYHCYAVRRTDVPVRQTLVSAKSAGGKTVYAGDQGIGADDIVSAYAIDTGTDASDKTIAIVDAYNYANLESDLGVYRQQFGLPPCTKANGCLQIVNQNGQTSPMPANSPPGDDWTGETALDVDMASAACPSCKILVVLANDDQGDGLFKSNTTASQMGADVISNSWGGPEDGSEASYEAYFNHSKGSTYVATGDNGFNDGVPDYPSTSAHTIGVGGTTLTPSNTARGWSEKAWRDGGSSCSDSIAKPSYQGANTGCATRATSDVAAVGDPQTGVWVYNAAQGGWGIIGGTSAASPLVAGIMAQSGRVNITAQYFYDHPDFLVDVTSGTNGTCTSALCRAGAGWDGPTGNGTPIAASIAADPDPDTGSGSGSGMGSGSNQGSGSGSNEGSDGSGGSDGSNAGSDGSGSGSNGDNNDGDDDQNGGGCSSSGGSAGGGSALLIGLAAFGLKRRRR